MKRKAFVSGPFYDGHIIAQSFNRGSTQYVYSFEYRVTPDARIIYVLPLPWGSLKI